MTDHTSAAMSPLVSRERYANVIADALRLYVGRGRRYSVKQLANATGVKDRVIECAMTNPATVDWRPLPPEALLSIALFLGADFTNEWLLLAKQGAFDLPEGCDPKPGDLIATVAGHTAEVAARGADNDFCSTDRAALARVGSEQVRIGMHLVKMGGRA